MIKLVIKTKIKQISLALCFSLLSFSAYAAGLGKLNVFSALGEPLNAEIELISVSPEEFASLNASLAPDDFYTAQGVDKTAIQNNVKVSVAKKPNGDPVVQLSSSQAVTDPFLDILIQVVWADGQFTREYTLLLDPPDYSASRVAVPTIESAKPMTEQSNTAQQRSVVTPRPADGKRKRGSNVVAETPKAESQAEALDGQAVTTVKGDSLSAIALRLNIQEVNLDQLLIGLYQANPSAFAGNINRLKVGQVLKVPSLDALQAIDKKEAKAEVRAQVGNWQAYTSKLSDAAKSGESSDSASNTQSKGKIVTEDKATPALGGVRDVVKLAKVDAGKASSSDAKDANQAGSEKSVADQANNLQDDLAAKQNDIKETDEKSAALAKQIADMKKLLVVKNKAMADTQQKAAQTKDKQVDAPSIFDVLDPAILSVVGALLAVLGVFLFWVRRKNKIISTADTVLEGYEGSSVATASADSPSFLSDFSSSNGDMIDTHEVDPIAEADVYLAYGRHTQAEDILKDAIQKTPSRYELHLKLLEIYAELKNTSAFEVLAGELFAQLGSSDPIWAKVSELGLKIDPANKLYQVVSVAPSVAAHEETKLAVSDFNDASLMEDETPKTVVEPLNFEMNDSVEKYLGNEAQQDFGSESNADIEEINFDVPHEATDLNLSGITLNFDPAEPLNSSSDPVTPIPDAFNGDFSNLLKVEKVEKVEKPKKAKTSQPARESQESKNNSEESAEVATKLELAVAYIDMADKEGALELLAEALKDGGPAQRERAQVLIDSLA